MTIKDSSMEEPPSFPTPPTRDLEVKSECVEGQSARMQEEYCEEEEGEVKKEIIKGGEN